MSDTTERPRTKTIEVSPPIKVGAGEFSTLDLRAPKVSEVKKAQTQYKGTLDSTTQMMTFLVHHVSGWPVAAVENLDYDIMREAFDFLSGFIEPGPKTSDA